MTSGEPEAFGFVPAHVVADLQDIGNWKSRATAIDVLHKCLNGVSSPSTLVPALADFVNFLAGLIADPNFKIAISSMSILGDLAARVGSELGPYLRVVAPALLEKFADSKILVRSATMKLVRRLMNACTPGAVLAVLGPAISNSNWRVREEVLNTFIMALLSFGPGSYDPVVAYQVLSAGLSDGKDKVRLVALEGMAVLHSRVSSGELEALMAGQRPGGGGPLPEALRAQVAARLENPALPGINADGLVEHVVEMPSADNPDMRLADAVFGGGAGAAKAPWTEATNTPARPRLRPAATMDPPGAGPGSSALGTRPPSLEQVGRLGSDPLPGGRRDGVPLLDTGLGRGGQLALPDEPGVISPAFRAAGGGGGGGGGGAVPPFVHAHTISRFGSQDPLGGGAPITAAPVLGPNGWGPQPPHPPHSHPPSQGHPGRPHLDERAASPFRESSGAVAGTGSSDSLQELRGGGGGAGGGGPHGHIAHGHGHASALQPLKHHWGASRSMESHGLVAGKSPVDSLEDSPLSPSKGGYTVILHGRHSGPAVTGDGCQRDSLDLLTRPASVRTQAAAELREGARGQPLHAHTHTQAQQPHPPSHPHPQSQSQQSQQSMVWLQSSLEPESAGTRQETFSPSKAEMLARLKNRQIEKRAATAQQSDASSSSTTSVAAAAAAEAAAAALAVAMGTAPSPSSSHSVNNPQPAPRRHLFAQTSDPQRTGDRSYPRGADAASASSSSRGYDSAASTPTRAMAPSGSPFDDGPSSAQSHRPPRAGAGALAARLGRGAPVLLQINPQPLLCACPYVFPPPPPAKTHTYTGSYAMPSSLPPGEESPARNPSPSPSPSPALNRLRVRSADPTPPLPGSSGAALGPATPTGNGGGGPAAAAAAGPFWEKPRGGVDVSTEELTPLAEPEKHIRVVISRLVEANHSDRKALDWQGQYEALVDARRLVRHHPEECFTLLGRAMDRELDELVPVMLKKAGEVSNAGRDNFLAAEADRTLGEMSRCCGESRCVTALLSCAGHKNPYVRGKVAFHLDNLLEACAGGGGGRQALSGNTACLERLFRTAAGFLEEGSLDTRTHGKRVIWHVKSMLASRGEFDRLVAGVTPPGLQRKVVEVVEGLNGPPPPPSRGVVAGGAGGGGGGSWLASRQGAAGGSAGGMMMMMMGVGGGGIASPARPLLEQVAGSLTQPPPPVRQGSYSAPSPMHSGGVTPERRRLPRQRTTDLDGIPETSGGNNSRNNSSNGRSGRLSAGAAAVGPGGPGAVGSAAGRLRSTASVDGSGSFGFGPGVSEVVVKSLQMLGAKDFRERMDALRAVEGVAAALPGAPDTLLMQLLDAVVARLGDANAKVSTLALELVAGLSATLRQRMALGLNTLVPALAAALGSANDKVRSVAGIATEALVGALDPGMLVQHFSHCVANGTLQRGKPLLAEKLVQIVGALYVSKPQLVARYAVPAAFALLNDGRGGPEAKAAAGVLLAGLARLMGPALLEQASSLSAVAQQRVADAVAATCHPCRCSHPLRPRCRRRRGRR
ncbi:hypothetical protein VOLCADRAFT_86333 [Volvox carteri f. nagariensis]|uniref:Uncharacterized protein ssa6 n=1 Tax=Volvox carteri f. nagariensis TaxID=3068 RepID=D8TIH8_VOLCA|nr:uncharacterized protein VOLCADRAFT_86333 [Volvox carteri f. nagariensis]EFJ52893.1 hypothetical protein VOLCADRAFT_86333 [Volvox carteri f. nagariensis]|eukprot:XP_002945898.1 hypothetical protein VOLCADRAFT_86333 [Volvox carteri f. nagariensis]